MRQFTLLVILLITGLFQVALAQNRTVSGRVTDRANNQGLPGVTVLVKGTTLGTATGNDGTFTLSAPPTATTLVFSYIGYTSVEQPIGNGPINVGLVTDAKQIGEVVVTGALGIQRQEREVGYATATLDTKELTQARPTNVVSGLAGKVSGLQIQTLSAGVNPAVRVTLRGSRSITGNNEALIVIDGIITTNQILAALNPDDVESTTILKGANAAALYGSQASNGALIITTRKGSRTPQINLSQTSQFESVSFLPKFQTEFGPGSPQDIIANLSGPFKPGVSGQPAVADYNYEYQYQGFENQQFGPRFDGSLQPFGERTVNGNLQYLTYEARPDEKRKFFNNGFQMQNGVSFSGGDDKTRFYASYQNVHNNGIVPKDKFDRNSFRFNASRELDRLTVGFNVSYSQQKSDVTSGTGANSVYFSIFNTTVMAPLTQYKDWQNNEFANPNGYYNAYYNNPYWVIDNNRSINRSNTLVGNIDLSYRLRDWLRVQYRIGTTNIDQASQATQNRFTYSTFVTSRLNGLRKSGTGTSGFVSDLASNNSRINSDLFISMDKTFGNISVKAILGNNVQQLNSRYNTVASSGLATPDLFNLSNRVGNLSGSDARFTYRSYSFYADLTLGYKDFFFLHGSGRNDNISILAPENRSYFYPSVDASLVFSNLVPSLRSSSFLDYGKLRGGIAKVSQPNILSSGGGVAEAAGAYGIIPIFSPGAGFPYSGATSYGVGNLLIQAGLLPETTISTEAGIELSFLKRRVTAAATYYTQKVSNQTIDANIAASSGFTGYRLNAGDVQNRGYELDLSLVPVRLESGLTVTIGGNFNYNNNEVLSLPNNNAPLALSTGGDAQVYAVQGQPFPVLRGTYYERVEDGPAKGMVKMIADPVHAGSYVPVKAQDIKNFGNTQPKYKYGFNASVAYKGLVLAGQGELRTGYVVYHAIGSDMDFSGASQRSAEFGRQDFVYPNSAISKDGGVTYTPNTSGITNGNVEFWASDAYNTTVAENYVTSGMFFKIREASLSYTLPAALTAKLGAIKGLSVNLFGRNIFTYVPKENMYTDPEFNFSNSNALGINTNAQTPPTKFYGASLNVTL